MNSADFELFKQWSRTHAAFQEHLQDSSHPETPNLATALAPPPQGPAPIAEPIRQPPQPPTAAAEAGIPIPRLSPPAIPDAPAAHLAKPASFGQVIAAARAERAGPPETSPPPTVSRPTPPSTPLVETRRADAPPLAPPPETKPPTAPPAFAAMVNRPEAPDLAAPPQTSKPSAPSLDRAEVPISPPPDAPKPPTTPGFDRPEPLLAEPPQIRRVESIEPEGTGAPGLDTRRMEGLLEEIRDGLKHKAGTGAPSTLGPAKQMPPMREFGHMVRRNR